MAQKLLILTLGAAYNYRETTYLMKELEEPMVSKFVAAPLIRAEQPDKVVVIGTVRSSWSELYNTFAVEPKDAVYAQMQKWEKNYDRNTKGEELHQMQKQVQHIFSEANVFGNIAPISECKIIITRYGLDEEQLLENYERLSQIETLLDPQKEYEVSFDITHSFRSMPIYNLAILNYLKYVSGYAISIRHVYYGNVEITQETEGVAPIVDLQELVGLLDLTNGISEFQNTGNSIMLQRQLPEEEKKLKERLEEFDWAVQVNDFSKILICMKTLLSGLNEGDKSTGKMADLRQMLALSISGQILQNQDLEQLMDVKKTPENVAEIQYLLCCWYLNQNRYGQALATGLEALRSYLVPFYLQSKKMTVDLNHYLDEKNRKAALDLMIPYRGQKQENMDELDLLLMKIEEMRSKLTPVRNMFAHNLMRDFEAAQEQITEFIHVLKKLRELIMRDRVKIAGKFQRKPVSMTAKEKVIGKNIRVIVTNRYDNLNQYMKFQKSANKKQTYEVYCLPKELVRQLSGGNQEIRAWMLEEYLKGFFDISTLHVILMDDLRLQQVIHYGAFLRKAGARVYQKTDNNMLPFPEMDFKLEYTVDTEQLLTQKGAVYNVPPIKVI